MVTLYLVVGALVGGTAIVVYYQWIVVPQWRRDLDAARRRIVEQNADIRLAASMIEIATSSINAMTDAALTRMPPSSQQVH
jgi:hypothetical protein